MPSTQQCEWDNGHTVRSSVSICARCDHDLVRQARTDVIAQPMQVANVPVRGCWLQLHFEGNDPAVVPFKNQVDLLCSALCAQM